MYNVRTILLSIQSLLGGARVALSTSRSKLVPPYRSLRPRTSPRRTCHPRLGKTVELCAAPVPRAPDADPNLDSPLNGHAASLWQNEVEYKKALNKHKSAHGTERRP